MINQPVSEAYLQHYGVLGMKWGVRRDKRSRSAQSNALANSGGKRARQIKADRKVAKTQIKAKTEAFKTAQKHYKFAKKTGNAEAERALRDDAREDFIKTYEKIVEQTRGEAVRDIVLPIASSVGMRLAQDWIKNNPQKVFDFGQKVGDALFDSYVAEGVRKANKILADKRGLPAYSTISLTFDKVKGVWA